MANTSSATLHPCLPNSIAESSAMTEPSTSGLLSDEMSSSPTLLSSQTCRFNGSATRQTSARANSLNISPQPVASRSNLSLQASKSIPNQQTNSPRAGEVLHAADGTTIVVPTQPLPATTSTYAPTALTKVTPQVIVVPLLRNRVPISSLQWERRPRFVRDYVWPDVELRDSTTALASQVFAPVPEPPQNELMSVEKWDTITSHPHLFRITTPIDVKHFCELLISHPNCPLVESMCKGLDFGFWPWAVTADFCAPSIQKVKDPSHLRFMAEQRDEEIRLGRFSSAFKPLLPGMTAVPLWVVPKPHSNKFRLVVDHSAGDYSPNSFIPPDQAGIHLDTLHVLGRALIRAREQHGSVPLVLFKTDVSQVYCHLPMHLLWQLHQVVSIQDSFHVDNNNNFGN